MRDDPDDYGEPPSAFTAVVVGTLVFVVGVTVRVRGWLSWPRTSARRRRGDLDDDE